MDKAVDQNDSYARTMELVEQYEREALQNETKADELEAEADRLRNVAKEKRAEAKKEQAHADEITGNKKKAAK
jgi:hypothetical protein